MHVQKDFQDADIIEDYTTVLVIQLDSGEIAIVI
jgi:hypothetical protein